MKLVMIFMLLMITAAQAEILKCQDSKGLTRYVLEQDNQDGLTCDLLDKRTPEQKQRDAKRQKEIDELNNAIYQLKVKDTAKFLNDVEKERAKLKRK